MEIDPATVTIVPDDSSLTQIGGKYHFFDPSIREVLPLADADMRAVTKAEGKEEGIDIGSSHRTKPQQQAAWDRYQSGEGGLAARPGKSRHEAENGALALDVRNYQKAAPYLKKYGFEQPFVGKGDPVHFQFPGAPGAYRYKPPTDISKARNMVAGPGAPELEIDPTSVVVDPGQDIDPVSVQVDMSRSDQLLSDAKQAGQDVKQAPKRLGLFRSQEELNKLSDDFWIDINKPQEPLQEPKTAGEFFTHNLPESAQRTAGVLVRLPGELKKSGLEAYDRSRQAGQGVFSSAVEGVAAPVADTAKGIFEQGKEFAKAPVKTSLTDPVGTAMLISMGKEALKGGPEIGKSVEMPKDTAIFEPGHLGEPVKLPEAATQDPKYIRKANRDIQKGLRPNFGKGTGDLKQQTEYLERTRAGLETIVKNKEGIELEGEKGKLPETLKQAQEAHNQTLESLFKQWDSMAKTAGAKGVKVAPDSVLSELQETINDKVLQRTSPGDIAYAQKLLDAYGEWQKEGGLSPLQAQQTIRILNEKTNAWYQNPSPETVGHAAIDARVAKLLREAQDEAISSTEGSGYQELRNQYRDLKTFEKDLNRRSWQDAKKAPKGFFDLSDVFSGGLSIHSLLSKNPAGLVSSVGMKAISEWNKHANNPNTQIKNLFKRVDEAVSKTPETIDVTPEAQKLLPPGPSDKRFETREPQVSPVSPEFSAQTQQAGQVPLLEYTGKGTSLAEMAAPGQAGMPARDPRQKMPGTISPDMGGDVGQRPNLFQLAGARPEFERPQQASNIPERGSLVAPKPGEVSATVGELEPGQHIGEPLGRKNIQLVGGKPSYDKPALENIASAGRAGGLAPVTRAGTPELPKSAGPVDVGQQPNRLLQIAGARPDFEVKQPAPASVGMQNKPADLAAPKLQDLAIKPQEPEVPAQVKKTQDLIARAKEKKAIDEKIVTPDGKTNKQVQDEWIAGMRKEQAEKQNKVDKPQNSKVEEKKEARAAKIAERKKAEQKGEGKMAWETGEQAVKSKEPELKGWLGTVPNREQVFDAMRDLHEKAESYHQKADSLKPRGGAIGVGAADFDETLYASVLDSYRRAISKGSTPDEAFATAKSDAREYIQKHNARRSRDVTWQRSETAADSFIEGQHRLFKSKVEETGSEAVKEKEPWEMAKDEALKNYYPKVYSDWNKVSEEAMKPVEQFGGEAGKETSKKAARHRKELLEAAKRDHYGEVALAISEGKLVPPEVLKDYPDLQPKPETAAKEYKWIIEDGNPIYRQVNKDETGFKTLGEAEKQARLETEAKRVIAEQPKSKTAAKEVKTWTGNTRKTEAVDIERKGTASKGEVSVKVVQHSSGNGYAVETTVSGDRRYPTEKSMSLDDARRFALDQLDNPREAKKTIESFGTPDRLMTERGPDANTLLEEAKQRISNKEKQVKSLIAEHGDNPIVLSKDGESIRGAVIAPSTKRPGKWQVTFFDKDGFSNDVQLDTREKAIREALDYNYSKTAPTLLDEAMKNDSFHKGNEKTTKLQAEQSKAWDERQARIAKAKEERTKPSYRKDSLKDQKASLLKQVDEAITALGGEQSGPGTLRNIRGLPGIGNALPAKKGEMTKYADATGYHPVENNITFKIGTAEYNIRNDKAALQAFRKNIVTDPIPDVPKIKPRSTSAGQLASRIESEGVTYYNEYSPRRMTLDALSKSAEKEKNAAIDKKITSLSQGRYSINPKARQSRDEQISALHEQKKEPATFLTSDGFVSNNSMAIKPLTKPSGLKTVNEYNLNEMFSGETSPVIEINEMKETESTTPLIHIVGENDAETFINPKYADAITTVYPYAKIELLETRGVQVAIFKNKGETVGIVYPVKVGEVTTDFISEQRKLRKAANE